MTGSYIVHSARSFIAATAFTLSMLVAGDVFAASSKLQESELVAAGFKVLVAKTSVQQDWVSSLPAGQIRPMQRTGKKFFIYPDAANRQIYIGGPKEYETYRQLHPDSKLPALQAAEQGAAYRSKQNQTMQKANVHDLSDPFLGADWIDLGW